MDRIGTKARILMLPACGLLLGIASQIAWFAESLAERPPEVKRPATPVERSAAILARHNYPADLEGVQRYFIDSKPESSAQADIRELIGMLGDQRYMVRKLATEALLTEAARRPQLVQSELLRAEESDDQEIRFRVRWIKERIDDESAELFLAVLRLIQEKPLKGLAEELLAAWSLAREPHHQRALAAALRATSTPADTDLLQRAIFRPEEVSGLEDPLSRIREPIALQTAAVESLRAALEEDSLETLRPVLAHPEGWLRLAAARAVVDFDPQAALSVLIELLYEEDEQLAHQAVGLLRRLTGENLHYDAFRPPEERRELADGWKQWYERAGRTAELRLPLESIPVRRQRLLLAMFNPNQVLHMELDGRKLAEVGAPQTPSGCVLLPTGDWVVAEWGSASVCKLDPHGKLQARHNVGGTPNGLDLLPSGNVLVALFSQNQVLEMDLDGAILWQTEVDSRPTDVRHLPNGNLLVALHGTNSLMELDSRRRPVWSIAGITSPESARPLENGNFLVAYAQGVAEFDRRGQVVWQSAHPRAAYDAVLLDNGNVLVADARQGLFEYSRDGKLIQQHDVGQVRRIEYY